MRTLFLFLVFLHGCVFFLHSQNRKLDSLTAVASSTKHDTLRAMAMSEIARIHLKNMDSVACKENEQRFEKLFKTSTWPKVGNLYFLTKALYVEKFTDDLQRTLEYSLQSYNYCLKEKDMVTAGKRLNRIAKLYLDLADYQKATEYYYKAVKVNEDSGNDVGLGISYFGLGELFRLQRNFKKAMEIYYRAYGISKKTQDPPSLSASYNNLGMMHRQFNNNDSAMFYYDLALKFNTARNNELEVANTLDRISAIQMEQKQTKEALANLEKALAIKLKVGNIEKLATTYINLSEACYDLHKDKEALDYIDKAIECANKKNLIEHLEFCLKFKGMILKALGRYEESADLLLQYSRLHDSLITVQNNKVTSELEEKYQSDKKKKEIELLNKDKKIQEKDLKTQKQFNYFIAIVAIMLAITVFFIFRGLRQKQKDNKALEEKNSIITEQKHIVEEKNREILDSINYAKRIQQSLLANEQILDQYLPNHFVFFKPKDIVSGDFYWAAKEGDKFYLAICDSTGHGVPGAFMSLLNIGFLAEAIKEKGILSPDKIFDYTRQRLIESISKDGQRDGFDGILVCFDFKTKKITYAAANNAPMLLVDGKLVQLPTDKMPVGLGEKKQNFSIFTIDHVPESILYLYTDGYADQFGGPKGKKFMYKKLNELLFTNTDKSLADQKQILKDTFDAWRGKLEQVDDVCVIGIKL